MPIVLLPPIRGKGRKTTLPRSVHRSRTDRICDRGCRRREESKSFFLPQRRRGDGGRRGTRALPSSGKGATARRKGVGFAGHSTGGVRRSGKGEKKEGCGDCWPTGEKEGVDVAEDVEDQISILWGQSMGLFKKTRR